MGTVQYVRSLFYLEFFFNEKVVLVFFFSFFFFVILFSSLSFLRYGTLNGSIGGLCNSFTNPNVSNPTDVS